MKKMSGHRDFGLLWHVNRLANVTAMRPNDEFYTLGRGTA